ncbi:increased DNA methylation 1-like [Malus sylvestris]|uniref:increased DNA methylation 1-like n=1 Tax=Malus sylvestris TaxID=3752 RepID=UPI0021AC13AF|nr:increased DNA methylation 1-like [Malus sylvestris]
MKAVKRKPVLTVEPELCPSAVQYWANDNTKNGRRNSDVTEKARRHLSALGWKFWYATKKQKIELRYESPTGKVYYSLRMACQACVNSPGRGGVFSESIGSNSVECSADLDIVVDITPQSTSRKTFKKREIGEISKVDDDWSPKQERGKTVKKRKIGGISMVDDDWSPEQKRGKVHADMKRLKRQNKASKQQARRILRSTKRARDIEITDPGTRNPRTVLSWLIESNGVSPNAKVHYRPRKGTDSPLATGRITREGIKCDCCSKVFTLTGFETHAGSTNHRPSAHIILEDGRTLNDCQRQTMKSRKGSTNTVTRSNEVATTGNVHQDHHPPRDQNDDICTVCHFGGDLILCDRCPAAFHTSCLGLKDVSEGDWFCPSCCCVKCGKGNPKEDRNNGFVICGQCDKKYHYGCLRNEGVEELERDSNGNWFCSRKCEGIYLGINKIVGKRILVGPDNLTWTLLRPSPPSDSDMEDLAENYSKLNLALSVMHECFEPSQDPYTKRDIVEDIIFNRESDLSRLNFRRFYTLLLERDEEVITVACVRIYSEVVEVPLVATRFHYRRQGMCRVLMDELENQLANLGVERLILPSASSTLDTWTSTSFGFSKMTADERMQFLNYTFMDFQGTIMCHKVLKQTNSATQAVIPFEGSTKFDKLPGAISTVTQAEDNQPENGALDQELGNIGSGHKFFIDDVDCMLLDNNEPSFLAWYNEQNFRLIPESCKGVTVQNRRTDY